MSGRIAGRVAYITVVLDTCIKIVDEGGKSIVSTAKDFEGSTLAAKEC